MGESLEEYANRLKDEWYQISRKYRMVAWLPPGECPRDLARLVDSRLRLRGYHAASMYLSSNHALKRTLTVAEFEAFRAAGGVDLHLGTGGGTAGDDYERINKLDDFGQKGIDLPRGFLFGAVWLVGGVGRRFDLDAKTIGLEDAKKAMYIIRLKEGKLLWEKFTPAREAAKEILRRSAVFLNPWESATKGAEEEGDG